MFVHISVEMKETEKNLLHKRVTDVKYKHIVTEDVLLFLCFWQWSIIAPGQAVKQTEGKTTTASDESFRWFSSFLSV